MLHLHRSADSDCLAGELARILDVPSTDPLRPVLVAVSAKGMERWLAQRLSHTLGAGGSGAGICANVTFSSPTRLLDDAATRAGLGAGSGTELGAGSGTELGAGEVTTNPWERERVLWPLVELLGEGAAGEPLTARLREGARCYPLAARLAGRFDDYGQERPAMLRFWAAGEDLADDGRPLPVDLIWQPRLWRALRARLGTPSPAERLPTTLERLREDPGCLDLPQHLHVFGLNRLSAARLAVLAAIANAREVHLWIPHASPALWSAVARGQAPRHPLLASLSRDAAALQRRVRAAAPTHTDSHHEAPAPPDTLLGQLQRTLAEDAAPGATEPIALGPGDHSISVHACHGPVRQVEVLRELVTELLAADTSLEPRDVLVMCPDVDTFAPLITAAFADHDDGPAGTRHPASALRVRLTDRSMAGTNPVFATVRTVLGMSNGRATATELLDLAATDAVARRFGFDADAGEQLRRWAAEAGVRWGLDTRHRQHFGLGAIASGTWRDALDRILLAAAMDSDEHWLDTALPLDGVDSADIELAGRFAEFVDRTCAALEFLSRPQRLSEYLTGLREHMLGLAMAAPGQGWQRSALIAELADIAEAARGTDPILEPSDLAALITSRLGGRPTRAGFRTGTVTVSTMVPMRSVPHRVIVLLGLDDTAFPRAGTTDADDILAWPARRPGERDPRTEDRQLLLDAVCSARDHLAVIYSGADERTGAAIPPAVPLGELLDALDGMATTTDGRPVRAHITVRHPLQSFDPRNFGIGAPAQGRAPTSFDTVALAGARAILGTRVAPRPFISAGLAPPEPGPVALTDLLGFLLHPARAFLRQRLDVSAAPSWESPAESIPLALTKLEEWTVGDRLLRARLAGADLATCGERERRRGTLPPNALGHRAATPIVAAVEAIVEAARADLLRADPDVADLTVDLPGGAGLVVGAVPELRGDVVVHVGYSSLGPKQRLTAWVELLALSAGRPDRTWQVVTVARRSKSAIRHVIGPLDPQVAAWELAALVRLREDGLCAPLPLPLKTSYAYVDARDRGMADGEALGRANEEWSGRNDIPGENTDPAHRLVWGPAAPLEALDLARMRAVAEELWAPIRRAERAAAS
ncbi:MAG: exodeoxyribonuclease V subunit gamma [Sporichthyaceae bacterium]